MPRACFEMPCFAAALVMVVSQVSAVYLHPAGYPQCHTHVEKKRRSDSSARD